MSLKKNKQASHKYIIFFCILTAGIMVFSLIAGRTDILGIAGFVSVILILLAGKAQLSSGLLLPVTFVYILLLLLSGKARTGGIAIPVFLSLLPYYKFKSIFLSLEKEKDQKFKQLEKEKNKAGNEVEKLIKKADEIKDKLKRQEKLYEISKDMSDIDKSEELAEKALSSMALKSDARFLAFYRKSDSNYKIVSSIGEPGGKDSTFLKVREEARGRNSYYEFPLIAGDDDLGKIICDGFMSSKQLEEAKVLASQITLGYQKTLLYEKVRELSRKDGLTGLYLRGYFQQRLNEEIKRAKRENYHITFVMADLDNFKEYNDTYGHPMGDRVLESVSRIIMDNIYRSDFAGRYGGEEFCLYMPHAEKEEALETMRRIKEKVKDKTPVTISIGISIFPEDSEKAEDLIETADRALYNAKESGKDCIEVFTL